MPTYAFRWTGEEAATEVELPDEHAAWSQAVTTTGELLREMDGAFPVPGALEMEVKDSAGHSIVWISVQARRGHH